MKKRILSLLLVVAMLAAMVVVPVYAAEGTENSGVAQSTTADTATDMSQTCPCGCGLTFAQITWTDLDLTTWATGKAKTVAEGHYRVTGSCEYTGQVYLKSSGDVVLDLAGATVTADACRNFYTLGTSATDMTNLTVIDSVGGAKLTSSYAAGGTVYAGSFSTINLYGGTWHGSDSATSSGALYVAGDSEMNVYAPTTVYGGTAKTQGGAAYVSGDRGVLNIHGGTIVDGTSPKGDGISINKGTVNISGGTVGTVYPYGKNALVNISGDAVVANLDLTLTTANTVTVNDLTEGASIGISETAGSAVGATFDDAQSYVTNGYVYSSAKYADVIVSGDALEMSEQICPHCDKAWSEIDWIDWNAVDKTADLVASGAAELNDADETYQAGGFRVTATDDVHYKLTADFSNGSYGTPEGSSTAVYQNIIDLPEGKTAVFDLAGYEWVAASRRVFCIESGGVALLDSSAAQTGVLRSRVLNTSNTGGVVVAEAGTVYTQYDGTVQRNTGSTYAAKHGGVIYATNATINIFGGTIANGSVGSSTVNGYGGNIYASGGTLTIRDAVVTGGTAQARGGNIYATGCDVTIENSKIIDGVVTSGSGGSIYLTAAGSSLVATGSDFIGGTCTSNGGTFYVNGADSIAFTDCDFEGGTCGNYGGIMFANCAASFVDCTGISGSADAAGDLEYPTNGIYNGNGDVAVTITDCDFEEVTTRGDATMSGTVTIDNYWPLNTGTTATISGLNTDSRITVYGGVGTIVTAALADDAAAQAYLDAGVFTSGNELQLKVQDAQIVAVVGPFEAYCHDCGDTVEWAALDLVETSIGTSKYAFIAPNDGNTLHYYLTEDLAISGQMIRIGYNIVDGEIVKPQGETVHIELNGNSYTNTGRGFYIYQGNNLHIQDTSDEGTGSVNARGADNQGGAVFYVEGAKTSKGENGETIIDIPGATLSVYGGTYTLDAGRTLGVGGVVNANGYTRVTAENATFDGSAFDFEAINGGTVYFASNSQGTLTDCTVIGGKAQYGGAMYIVGSDVTLDGETVVKDGYAYERAGNIYVTNSGAELILTDDVQVIDGYAVGNGGNFYVTSTAILNISGNAMISGGDACNGGNAYFPSGGILQMSGGTVKDGVAYNDGVTETYGRGGNLYLGGAAHTISGGSITGGVSQADDPTTEFGGGNLYVYSGGSLTISGGAIVSGGSTGTNGGNIYAIGDLVLENAAISGGTATNSGADIYLGDTGSINISENITGNLGMGFHDDLFEGATPYGSKVLNTAATTLNATLTLDGTRGNVPMYAQDGALWVQGGGVAIEDLEGKFEYFADPADAVKAFNEETDAWLVICGAEELVLGVDSYSVDVNGCNVNISGEEGSDVTCVDSANEDYKTYGLVTLDENVVLNNDIQTNAAGHDFFTVEENDQYSFHILDMEITAVSLKTSSGGLYYYAKYYCDSKLAEYVDTFGIVTQLNSMPTDFNEDTTLYSEIAGSKFVANKEITGATMNNIITTTVNEGMTNDQRGDTKVYAAPYVILTTGGEKIATEEVGMSLKDCCDAIDDMISDLLAADAADATAANYIAYMTNLFTNVWDKMGLTWTFKNFPDVAEVPEA